MNWICTGALIGVVVLVMPELAAGQEESAPVQPQDTSKATTYPAAGAGEFNPARGFDIVKTERGSLNISFYGLARYINHTPGDDTFIDHLGRERTVKARNDINWHRAMVWFTGFFWKPELRYNLTVWSLATTQQSLLYGNLQWNASRAVNFAVGMLPNLTARSMQGSFPFWAGSDRTMGEEFFRAGFSSGFAVSGEPIPRVYYSVSVNNNASQLGVTAANDTRDLATSASIYTMPTTGEFGPRGGFGDLEHHEEVATRFGISGARSRESRYAPDDLPPNATQIRLSDGLFPFETGALAEGVTVQKLDFQELAFDAAVKYKGFSLNTEYYVRKLSDFQADGLLPLSSVLDHGFMAQTMYMVKRSSVGVYLSGGYVFDDFDRKPWELSGGVNYYPTGTRSYRVNLHVIHVERSPTGSNFGYYTIGQTGTTFSLGVDVLI